MRVRPELRAATLADADAVTHLVHAAYQQADYRQLIVDGKVIVAEVAGKKQDRHYRAFTTRVAAMIRSLLQHPG